MHEPTNKESKAIFIPIWAGPLGLQEVEFPEFLWHTKVVRLQPYIAAVFTHPPPQEMSLVLICVTN